MSIFLAGDVHGKADPFLAIQRFAIKNGIQHVIQVGDFGLLWQPDPLGKLFNRWARKGEPGPTWYTCGGNHDVWPKWLDLADKTPDSNLVELAPNAYYVKRGTTTVIDGKVIAFLGGAESVDKHLRVEGKSWWREETPTEKDFTRFFDSLNSGLVDVVVTHDCPESIRASAFSYSQKGTQPTAQALQRIVELSDKHAPLWFFGHHHSQIEIGPPTDPSSPQTAYYCCGLEGDGYWLKDDGSVEQVNTMRRPFGIAQFAAVRGTKN